MKTIRDPIHGDIELSSAELAVVDSEAMQRLRRIKQLSFCSLVYPGANQSRFEHSLGTMALAGRIAVKLDLERDLLRMAALIHDLGHLPFSHSLESVFEVNHEDNLELVLKDCVGDDLSDNGFDCGKILKLIKGDGIGKIISSQIDADRMDYLLRDSHYTGVAYGVIDVDRVINVIGFDGDELFFKKKGIIALESLLMGRHQMYEAVYFHHTVRVADVMLQHAMSEIKDKVTLEDLLMMGDEELKIFAKGESKIARELLNMLDDRQLYKVAYTTAEKVNKGNLLKKTGLEEHQLLISPQCVEKSAFNIKIDDEGGLKNITEVSKTALGLKAEMEKFRETKVCVPSEFKEKVRGVV